MSGDTPTERADVVEIPPRLLRRKDAAPYMGRSLRKFDQIAHLFHVVVIDGMKHYDRLDLDRLIELSKEPNAPRPTRRAAIR